MATTSSSDRSESIQLRRVLHSYLTALFRQPEAGLIIIQDNTWRAPLLACLEKCGLERSRNSDDVLQKLQSGKSTFILLRYPLDRKLYEVIVQYYRRGGTIQLFDSDSHSERRVDFEPFETHLLLVTEESDLLRIEKHFGIRDKVGVIEAFLDDEHTHRIAR